MAAVHVQGPVELRIYSVYFRPLGAFSGSGVITKAIFLPEKISVSSDLTSSSAVKKLFALLILMVDDEVEMLSSPTSTVPVATVISILLMVVED